MPVLIVGEERSFSQLRPRVFEGRVSRAAYRRVGDAVREANPHVDLARLQPGTVLTIPDLPDVGIREDLSTDEITKRTIEEAVSTFNTAMATTQELSAARAKTDKSARTRVARALEDPAVARAKRTDKQLAADVEMVAAALAADEERAKAGAAAFKKAAATWSAELEKLREQLG